MGGGDKTLLPLGGGTVLSHVASRLSPQVDRMAISANGDPRRFSVLGLPVVADSIEGHAGPLAGILAGMDWAAQAGGMHMVSVAGDTPFFPSDLVARLSGAVQGNPGRIAFAASGGKQHPVFALWPLHLAGDLRDFLEEGRTFKVRAFIEDHEFAEVEFPMMSSPGGSADPFFNINTPDDLVLAQTLSQEIGG
jgi:molybdopterin-guanine dinucleotide biosynthesis protein A